MKLRTMLAASSWARPGPCGLVPPAAAGKGLLVWVACGPAAPIRPRQLDLQMRTSIKNLQARYLGLQSPGSLLTQSGCHEDQIRCGAPSARCRDFGHSAGSHPTRIWG